MKIIDYKIDRILQNIRFEIERRKKNIPTDWREAHMTTARDNREELTLPLFVEEGGKHNPPERWAGQLREAGLTINISCGGGMGNALGRRGWPPGREGIALQSTYF